MEKTQKGPRTWPASRPETQKKINKYSDSGNECCPGQPAIPGKKLRNLIRKLISTHTVEGNLMSNKPGRFKSLQLFSLIQARPFSNTIIDLKPHRGIQWKSFKPLFDAKPLTQAIHRAIYKGEPGRFDSNIILGFVDKWSIEIITGGILNQIRIRIRTEKVPRGHKTGNCIIQYTVLITNLKVNLTLIKFVDKTKASEAWKMQDAN